MLALEIELDDKQDDANIRIESLSRLLQLYMVLSLHT